MRPLLFLFLFTLGIFAQISPADLENKSFRFAGNFYPYPFWDKNDPRSAFNWIFETPSKKIYQMHGTTPASNNVFGWKRVDIRPLSDPSWRFYFLGDIDHDGDTRFDFLTVSYSGGKRVFKLLPTPIGSFFKYQNMGFMHFDADDRSIRFHRGFLDYVSLDRNHIYEEFPDVEVLQNHYDALSFLSRYSQEDIRRLQELLKKVDFEHNVVVLKRITEPSGSIGISLAEPLFLNDEVAQIAIQENIPPVGTADMAYYLAVVTASKNMRRLLFRTGDKEWNVALHPKPICDGEPEMPVCGLKQIECITTPCEPIETTYPNYCTLKATQAQYLHMGSCEENKSDDPKRYAASLYGFGSSLAKELYDGENLLFSPLSIAAVMDMLYVGSSGRTREQIGKAFFYPEDLDVPKAYERLRQGLSLQEDIEMANGAWVQEDYALYHSYRYLVEDIFDASVHRGDFLQRSEAIRQEINGWVEQKTRQRIKDLLPPHSLDPSTKMVLVNALYFHGQWDKEFNTSLTQKEPFFITPQKSVLVDMMQKTSQFDIATFDDFRVLALPYREKLSMWIFLPKPGLSISSLLQKSELIDAKMIKSHFHTISNVSLKMPKFKMEWGTKEISTVLKSLGIEDLFSPNCDFSNMADVTNQRLYVSGVYHKAFIEVDEKGTTAAAATAGIVSVTATPNPVTFYIDRPFVFMIVDNINNAPLFMGVLKDPS